MDNRQLTGVKQKRAGGLFLLAGVWLFHLNIFAATAVPDFELKSIAAGVQVAFKPAPHRLVDSNITIIEAEDCRIIIDAYDNLEKAKSLVEKLKAQSQKPVCYVINTHWHSDHTLANAIYRKAFPEIKAFVGHQNLPELMRSRTREQLSEKAAKWAEAIERAKQKFLKDKTNAELKQDIEKAEAILVELEGLEIIPPSLTFTDELELPVKGIKVQLLNFGDAHTTADTIVFLPEQKLLIAGDLFDHLPFAGHGYPTPWLKVLNQVELLNFEKVVPGHGTLQTGKAELHLIQRLLREAIDRAAIAVKANQTKQAFMDSLPMTEYRQWFGEMDDLGQRAFNWFIPEFFERAYLEAAGKLDGNVQSGVGG